MLPGLNMIKVNSSPSIETADSFTYPFLRKKCPKADHGNEEDIHPFCSLLFYVLEKNYELFYLFLKFRL